MNYLELECKKELTISAISFLWAMLWNNPQISMVYYTATKLLLLILYEHCGSVVAVLKAVSHIHICSLYLLYVEGKTDGQHLHSYSQGKKQEELNQAVQTYFKVSDWKFFIIVAHFSATQISLAKESHIERFNTPGVRKFPSHERGTR